MDKFENYVCAPNAKMPRQKKRVYSIKFHSYKILGSVN